MAEAGGVIPPLGDVKVPDGVLELDREEAGNNNGKSCC